MDCLTTRTKPIPSRCVKCHHLPFQDPGSNYEPGAPSVLFEYVNWREFRHSIGARFADSEWVIRASRLCSWASCHFLEHVNSPHLILAGRHRKATVSRLPSKTFVYLRAGQP